MSGCGRQSIKMDFFEKINKQSTYWEWLKWEDDKESHS